MKISLNSLISPISKNLVQNRQVIPFCGLKLDVFEKQETSKKFNEQNLNLFMSRLSNDDESSIEEVKEEVKGLDDKHKKRLSNLINNPDIIKKLKNDDNEFFAQIIMIVAAYLEDDKYKKIEPYINSGKLNLGKTLVDILYWTRIDDKEFDKIQEFLAIDDVVNLINDDKLSSNSLKYLARVSVAKKKDPLDTFKSKACIKLMAEGILNDTAGYQTICFTKDEICKIEKLAQNKNAVELLKSKKLSLPDFLKLENKQFEYSLKLLENENFANILRYNPLKAQSDSNPDNWCDIIADSGNYFNETEEDFQKDFDKYMAVLNSDAATILISNFKISTSEIFSMACMTEDEFQKRTEIIKTLAQKKQSVIENHKLYTEGEYEEDEENDAIEEVNEFFNDNKDKLFLFTKYADKETLDALLRQRFGDAGETLEIFDSMGFVSKRKLYNKLINMPDKEGKPLSPNLKLQFVDIINAYVLHGGEEKLYEVSKRDYVDIEELNKYIFNKIMENIGIDKETISLIPHEKIAIWDTRNIHLLAKQIRESNHSKEKIFKQIIQATCLGDFKKYIHNKTNTYGKINSETRKIFEEAGINYDLWVSPPDYLNMKFQTSDKNMNKLIQISKQIEEDIENLRKTPLKGIIDKRFKKETEKDKFKVPDKCIKSKEEMTNFVQNIIEQLNDVWARAEKNVEDPKKSNFAKNTLTILDHLNQRLKDIEFVSDLKITKPVDLTIKMWGRNPAHDLFQGNYSTCCIGMGGGNGSAMPHYLANTAFNMIELVDNKNNQTMGNALCYFVKDKNNEPVFILDNVEINNSKKLSDEAGIKLRNALKDYASNLTKALTGRDDIKIYIGTSYNDIPTKDLERDDKYFDFMGKTDCDENYLDLYGGWVRKEDIKSSCKACRLK